MTANLDMKTKLGTVRSLIKKSRRGWFGHVESKDDADGVKCAMTIKIDGNR